jgi:hypothetical protein
MFNRENLEWMKEAPKMSFNETLGRPVFLNKEAFYVCLSGASDPSIFSDVEFEIDESFENFFKESTGYTSTNSTLVSQFICGMVNEADSYYQNFEPDEGVDVFTVPPDNPTTENQTDIQWVNTESMDKAAKKYNEKVRRKVFAERMRTTEQAVEELGVEILADAKTFKEYKEAAQCANNPTAVDRKT